MGIADSISIHAPRTGSDGGCRRGGGSHHISIHAPRTGSDVSRGLSGVLHRQFQSTLPARGATSIVDGDYVAQDISIHAPRTGSDARALALLPCLREISIHAPRTGSDAQVCGGHNFNRRISIHAPRTGSDAPSSADICPACAFQSTLPARGATPSALLMALAQKYFNPRSPHGERPALTAATAGTRTISIHAPRTGSDVHDSCGRCSSRHFNPRSPHGERRKRQADELVYF